LIVEAQGKNIQTASAFRAHFNCPISFVPILGPVEHNENLFEREAARLALFNYRAARNFRNIRYHYPEKFDEFRNALMRTWPGMDIEPPKLDYSHSKPRLHMFRPEDRIPLTQLAKTKKVVFVEGKDFQILGRFARKLGVANVSNRSGFAVVPVDGFNPERVRSLKIGMETTLGTKIMAAALLDKDYRCNKERTAIVKEGKSFCDLVIIYRRKEIENFLLVPAAIDRAAARKVADQGKRTGVESNYATEADTLLDHFAVNKKSYVTAQYLAERKRFERIYSPHFHEATINEAGLDEFEACWKDAESRLEAIPGKEAISVVNQHLQKEYGVSVTATAIIDAMRADEVPSEMQTLIHEVSTFASNKFV